MNNAASVILIPVHWFQHPKVSVVQGKSVKSLMLVCAVLVLAVLLNHLITMKEGVNSALDLQLLVTTACAVIFHKKSRRDVKRLASPKQYQIMPSAIQ